MIGPRSTKSASDGIVYMIPVIARVGVYERRQRVLNSDSGIAIEHAEPDREHGEHDVLDQAVADLARSGR